MKSAFGRWNSLVKSNTARFLYYSLAATLFLALPATAQSTGSVETRTEEALLRFHNEFLIGTEYSQAVRYPATTQQKSAWTHLIIAVGQDVALIMTAGKTELIVKKMEIGIRSVDFSAYGVKILQSMDDRPLNTALEIAAVELADKGIQHVTNMPVSIPGLRSGVAMFAVGLAELQKEKRINEAVNRQVELLQMANYVAPAIAEISQLITEVKSDQRAKEYLDVFGKMMARKAELNVYRQMQYERHQSACEGIEGLILQEIDYNLAVAVAESRLAPTAHRQVLPVATRYAMGLETKEGLDWAIKSYIDQNKPPMESAQYVERIFNAVQRKLGPLEKARKEINAYGGSTMHSNNDISAFLTLAAKTGVAIASPKSDESSIALGFLIDSSGSMARTDPHNIRVEATKLITDYLDGSERIFIIDFDATAKWINADNYRDFDRDKLKRSIAGIDSDGGTEIGLALQKMREIMSGHLASFARTGVLLLSDGESRYGDEARWFADNNIPVYTISYKDMGDIALLARIAAETDGILVQADTEEDVLVAFLHFYNRLAGQNRYLLHSGTMADILRQADRTFFVDPGATRLYGNLGWNAGNLTMELQAPSGKTFTEGSAMGSWSRSNSYTSVRIDQPESGKWIVKLDGASADNPAAHYSLDIGGKSPIELDLSKVIGSNGLRTFNINDLNHVIDVTKATAKITVNTPAGNPADLSATFRNGSFSYRPTDGEGVYKYRVELRATDQQGRPIERVFTGSDFVETVVVPYIAQIAGIIGNYITAPLGLSIGNFEGLKAYIYAPGYDKTSVKAIGHVTNVSQEVCTIEIEQTFGPEAVTEADLVELEDGPWTQ